MVKNQTATRPVRTSKLLGSAPAPLVLKIEGTERDGQILRIHTTKCLVGSGADCQLRLVAADVLPKHCVIYRGRGGMAVKSWTRDTRVNGNTISEAWLRIGDRLSLGSLNFEVLADSQDEPTNQAVNPAERTQAQRTLRRRAHRRIRGLLDVVRDQKNSFGSLQNRLDETQRLVDSLLANQSESDALQDRIEAEKASRTELRKRGHRRAKALLASLRQLAASNEKLHTQLREQLAEKQEQIDQIQQRLLATSDATQAERDQHRKLQTELHEAEATIAHLREQAAELEARQQQLHDRWLSTRQHGKGRVKSILAHLRQMRDRLGSWEEEQTAAQNETLAQLGQLQQAYDETTQQLDRTRETLKSTESELAWSQQELQQRETQSEELARQIQQLERQLAEARQQQADAEAQAATISYSQRSAEADRAEFETQRAQLRHELEEAGARCDRLELRLEELREQNACLQENIGQLRESEATLEEQLEEARQNALNLRRQLEEDRRNASVASRTSGEKPAQEPGEKEALDHLRSMGILRETPPPRETGPSRYSQAEPGERSAEAVAEDDATAQAEAAQDSDPPAEDRTTEAGESAAVHPMTGLSSFPDSQFPEKGPAEEVAVEAAPEVAAEGTTGEQAATGDDDVSIDDYMKNLLERMRAKQGEATVPPMQPAAPVMKKPEPTAPVVEEEPLQPISDEEFRPSRFAPEQTSDIRKLRELANETAKAAIDSATLNRWELMCKSKLVVATCALLAGFVLHYLSEDYMSLSFAGACLAYVVTVFWWLQSAVIYNHVKTHRRERVEQRIQDEIIAPKTNLASHSLKNQG